MSESRSPTDLVLALVRVINGDLPDHAARELLDPMVQIRVDTAEYRGIGAWFRWIYLIRHCGRVSRLRITQCRAWRDARDPALVHLSARWTGTVRSGHSRVVAGSDATARYLVRDGRIAEIWTRKSNYEFIFGSWISHPVCYRLFLGWSMLRLWRLSMREAWRTG